MAGDYFPISADLPRKREVVAIANATGRSRHEVIGLCIELWAWAQHETTDGQIVDVCVDGTVDALVTLVGADVLFWCEMVRVGWLKVEGNVLVIPNFHRWMSKGAKARYLRALRQQRWREKRRNADVLVDVLVDAPVDACRRIREEKSISSKEEIGGRVTRKAFAAPTLEQVTAYCKERNNQINAQMWLDHYTSNGWMVGKNKMKDWRAAVRTWERNNFHQQPNGDQDGPVRIFTGRKTNVERNGSGGNKADHERPATAGDARAGTPGIDPPAA